VSEDGPRYSNGRNHYYSGRSGPGPAYGAVGRAENGMIVPVPARDRTGPVRADKFIQLAADRAQVRACPRRADVIFLPDQAHGLPFGGLLQEQVRHQGGSWVKVQDPVGIDDQRPVPVRVKPQVDAAFLIRPFAR